MKKRAVYCMELDKWFESIACASKETGVSVSTIRYCLENYPDCPKYTWYDNDFFIDLCCDLCELSELANA